jgi:hypothetical protein
VIDATTEPVDPTAWAQRSAVDREVVVQVGLPGATTARDVSHELARRLDAPEPRIQESLEKFVTTVDAEKYKLTDAGRPQLAAVLHRIGMTVANGSLRGVDQ